MKVIASKTKNFNNSLLRRYRKIPKISPSMYKTLQIKAPQTGNAKNPPLKRLSKYKPPRGLVLGKLPSNTKENKAKMVNLF